MHLLGSPIPISKKSLRAFKKTQGKIDSDQEKIYKEAMSASKIMREAIQNLNNASNAILRNYYMHGEKNSRNSIDQYLQKAVMLSERYQSLIFKELNQEYKSQTVFQVEGQVFAIINIDIAAKKFIKTDISAQSKGGRIKGRFNLPNSIVSLSEQQLKEEYGIVRLMDQNSLANNPIKKMMDLFLNADDKVNKYNNIDYRITRGDQGKYLIDWMYEGQGYHGEIGNEGDLSEIYLAAIFNDIDLSGNAFEKFIKATNVDNISGLFTGDFRRKIGNEFSAKSNRASYTLINQMESLAYQIIGLNAAGVNNIEEIIKQEYESKAEQSSKGQGRNIVNTISERKIKEALNLDKYLTI